MEGAVSFVNQNGCSQTQDDVKYTSDVLAGFAANPNVYGVVVVGNGCEVLGADRVIQAIRARDAHKPVYRVVIQEEGGTPGAIEKGSGYARALAEEASQLQPEEFDLSHLIVATECGGSDATSGIAANPVVGAMSDRVIAAGGTVILSETTEFMGAEHILARRAATPEIGRRILDCVERYESYLKSLHTDLRGTNPAPGNKKGGITTLEEKSLGCIYKGGSSTIMGVYDYACRYPGGVAAAVAICGAVNPSRLKEAKGVKWSIYHGDADPVVPVEASRAAYKALKACYADVQYHEFIGCGHNARNPAFNTKDFFKWMFDQSISTR